MKTSQIYILFDGLLAEYLHYYGESGENKLINDLEMHLLKLSENSQIIIITNSTDKISEWFFKNNLSKFIYSIEKPVI